MMTDQPSQLAPDLGLTSHTITVLLVDDQRVVGDVVGHLLADQKDISFHYISDPKLLVKTAAETNPTIILQDLVMPGVDGLQLVRYLRGDPRTREIPIIVLSSREDPQTKADAFMQGANDYLVKLPDKIELVARIRYHSQAYINKLERDEAFRALRDSQEQLAQSNIALQRLVAVDGLTGIANRRRFDEFIDTEWKRARRLQMPISVVLSDIDHFKFYNDTYGHLNGDICLKKVAGAFAETLKRPADLAARYGGEEFVMVLPDTDNDGAMHIAEAVRANVEALQMPHAKSSASNVVTVSMGVATLVPQDEAGSKQLTEAADKALYTAKESGRNRVERAATGC